MHFLTTTVAVFYFAAVRVFMVMLVYAMCDNVR